MGGHNRTYPSLRWVGLDDEQIVRMNGSCDIPSRGLSDIRPWCLTCKDRLVSLVFFGLFGLFG